MAETLSITRPDDWHAHFRDGEALKSVAGATARQFARAIVMPNLVPPVTTTRQAKAYRDRIVEALPKGSTFEPLMTLYLTDDTAASEIERAKEAGFVKAVKYYPAGATTNSASGVTDIRKCDPVLDAMQSAGMPLLIHGEVTDPEVDIFDRETVFIERQLAVAREAVPDAEDRARAHHDARRRGVRGARAGQHRRDDHGAPPAAQPQRDLLGRHPARTTTACRC